LARNKRHLLTYFRQLTKDFDVGVRTALLVAVDKNPTIFCPGAIVFVIELNTFLVLALGGVCRLVRFSCRALCLLGLSTVLNIPDHACLCCSMIIFFLFFAWDVLFESFFSGLPVLISCRERC
jgi:hypothetical protein